MRKTTWLQRAAIVPAAVFCFCGAASAATLGTISGTGTFNSTSSWSFSGLFDFVGDADSIFGDVGQYQFNAGSAGLTATDGNTAPSPANPTHLKGPAAWEILNTYGVNSTFYGPSFNWTMGAGNAITGTLATDGSIHWFYGYDEDTGGKTSLASFGLGSNLDFVGSYNMTGTNDFSFGGTVSAAPIPEPETYAMLLVGLGMLGFAARRRKQQAT
jgi:hypothetical protein